MRRHWPETPAQTKTRCRVAEAGWRQRLKLGGWLEPVAIIIRHCRIMSLTYPTAMPYKYLVQSVIQTPTFLMQAKRCGLTDSEVQEIVAVIAVDPKAGALMPGTGGARKLRHAREGMGQSGGFRTIHYFGGDDIPVFALAIYGKNEKGNLSKAERNELASILPRLADAYRLRKDKA